VLDGAVHDTTDRRFPFDVAETEVGALGTVAGVAAADAAEASDIPEAFVAFTWNV